MTLLCHSLVCHSWANASFSNGTGTITPSGLIITVSNVSLITTENKTIELWSGTSNLEFTRAGAAFAAVPIGSIVVPAGRYRGVSLAFNYAYQVKLNGDTYIGTNGSKFNGGTALYTTSTGDGRVTDAVTTTTGTAAYKSNITNIGTSGCTSTCSSQTYFTSIACVAPDASQCKSGEKWVGGNGTILPNINVMVDIYQQIYVDANDGSLAKGAIYPYAVIGTPGAAIHLTAVNSTSGVSNVSLIFSSDKSLIYISTGDAGTTLVGPGGGTTPGVTATGGPNVNAYGPTMITEFNSTTGKVRAPLGGCATSTCISKGLASFDNVIQSVGSTVNFTCAADTTGALDYTYTGGACSGVTAGAYKVARIIDPSNIFNICTSPTNGACSATSSQIAGTSSDGYL